MLKDQQLRVGVAAVDITPPPGCDLSGFIARQNPSVGVRDPVFARALTLDDGQTTVALLTCDLLGLEARTIATIRQQIAQATRIPATRIMIAASHTHSAPASMFLNGCGTTDPAWLAELPGSCVTATTSAIAVAQPARLAAGVVEVEGISANRRVGNGPIDRTLEIVRVDDGDGAPFAVLFNYACHPVTPGASNRLISADFPGALTRHFEAQTGATVLFANGASAGINPAGLIGVPIDRNGNFAMVEEMGRRLAHGALRRWSNLAPVEGTRIQVASRVLPLPFRPAPSEDELATFDAIQQGDMTAVDDTTSMCYRNAAALRDWVRRTRDDVSSGRFRGLIDAEIQVITVGDVALIGIPGEFFTSLGLQIKQSSPFPHTHILTFTNGNIGYIPAREAYPDGGYEVDIAYRYYGYPAGLAPEAGEMIVATAVELLQAAAERE
jgi:neutral ceramidase